MREYYKSLTTERLIELKGGVQWELQHSFNKPEYKVETIQHEMDMLNDELKSRK